MKAFVFPGQGAQFVGMGKDLYENSALAKELFEKANDILGYRITDIMFNGTDEDLRQTKVTQPAVFLQYFPLILDFQQVIIYIVKLHHFRIKARSDLTDTVPVHLLKGNGLLCCGGLFCVFIRSGKHVF